jgi:transcriptional regulator with XRE-family HTH domain
MTIDNWEEGKAKPSAEKFKRFSKILGVDFEYWSRSNFKDLWRRIFPNLFIDNTIYCVVFIFYINI